MRNGPKNISVFRLSSVAVAFLAVTTIVQNAQASVIQVNTETGVTQNGLLDWSVIPVGNVVNGSPDTSQNVSISGPGANVTVDFREVGSGDMLRQQQPISYNGNFDNGDAIVSTNGDSGGGLEFNFSRPVGGFGMQIQKNSPGAFSAQVSVYDSSNTLIDTFTRNDGFSDTNVGTAIFLGVESDNNEISRVVINETGTSNFAVSSPRIQSNSLTIATPAVVTNSTSRLFDQITSNGTLNVGSGSVLTSSTTVTNQAGGVMSVDAGSTLTGATIENSGLFTANGDVDGSFNNNNGGTLKGGGSVETLAVNSGSTLAPGNSTGTLASGSTTFAGGGTFQLEVNDFSGTAGSTLLGWDLLDITGTLNITATLLDPFLIDLTSLNALQTAGFAANFDPNAASSLEFVRTTGGISGFNSDFFTVDTTNFFNTFAGQFGVTMSGNSLFLGYTPSAATGVPEPGTWLMMGLGTFLYGAGRRRKKKSLSVEDTV